MKANGTGDRLFLKQIESKQTAPENDDIVKMAETDGALLKLSRLRIRLISALGTDPETGDLFEYNPMFGGKAKQKRCHKRIKVKDSKNHFHRKNKAI